MKVTVHEDRCIGAGQCVMTLPDVFDQDEDSGTVMLLRQDPPAGLRGDVARAVRSCPARAIEVDEPGDPGR